MNGNTYDVVIIGGGVIGSSIARALSKYECRTVLLEKEEDVCSGTSKANSAIVHAGYDAKTGSLKAKLNVKGNAMMGDLSKELDFDFKRNSSLVLCFAEEDRPALQALYERGVANGVPDISILTGDEVRKMEPNVSGEVVAALYAPTGGIVCPFGLTIALAENACDNGVEFVFNTKAEKVEKTTEGYRVITNNGVFETKYVVNAAGVYSDEIHNMVSEKKLHIVPRRGEYCLLDKEAGNHVSATVFQLPGKYGKGILVSPTIHGNLLVGPTAVDQEDKDGTYTTAEGLAEACKNTIELLRTVPDGRTDLTTVIDDRFQINSVTVGEDGTATVDLASVPENGMDNYSEQFFIYQITGSLVNSFEEVTGVTFTVGGQTVETIGGHLDASARYTVSDLDNFNAPGVTDTAEE